MQSMGCHSVAEQLMAAGATDEDVKKISYIMAQTVRQLEVGSPEPGLEALKPACDVVVLDAELPSRIPGFQQYGHRKPRSHQEEFVERSHGKETFGEEVQAGGRCLITCSVSGFGFGSSQYLLDLKLSRVGETENPGLVCATAKLFGAKYDAIVQWAQNLSSKSEVELEPLFAQVGERRQMFSRTFRERIQALHVIGQSRHPQHSQPFWIDFPCLSTLNVKVTLHTLNNFATIPLSFSRR